MSKFVLAADIGGTNIRAALVDERGQISDEQRIQADLSRPDISESDVIATLGNLLREFLDKHPHIQAIGLGFPGFFIGHSGILAASPNLPHLRNVKLAQMLSDSLNTPVFAQNDALCAAIGEWRFGAAQGQQNLLHITLGTGVGGGLILHNEPYTGEGGMAMEFGHLRVSHDDASPRCGCGGHGCVEAYASATAVSRQYFELGGCTLSSQQIHEKAIQGDTHAIRALENAGHKLGMAIAEAIKLLDIRTVTISGGLTGAWSLLHPAIMQAINQFVIPPLQGKISVLPSSLNDQAGLLGAAALAAWDY